MVTEETVGATGPAQNKGTAENTAATEAQPATAENTKSEKSSAQKKNTRRTRKKPDASPAEPAPVQPTPTQAAAPPKKKKWYKNPVPIILLLGAFLVIGGLIYFIGSKSGGTEVIVEQKDPNCLPLQQAPGTAIVHGKLVLTDYSQYRIQDGDTDIYSFVAGENYKLVDIGNTRGLCRWYGDGKIQIMDSDGNLSILSTDKRLDGNQYEHVFMRVFPGSGTSMTVKLFPEPSHPTAQKDKTAGKEYVLEVRNNNTKEKRTYAFGKK